jgi:hypothetical protein
MLLGQRRLVRHVVRPGKSRRPDRLGGLMRPLQIARKPHRVARQDFSDRLEYHAVAGVAAEILLPIDAAAILANRRVTHPPPPCRDDGVRNRLLRDERLVWIGHRKDPSILSRVLR